jgi:hypothetical protein
MKIPRLPMLVLGCASFTLAALPVLAHHSFASEYASKEVTLTGTITKVEWTNPHMYFYIDVKDASGNVVNYAVEGYPPNTLKRTGFTKSDLKIGDMVTVTAYPAKDNSSRVAGREVTFPDGSKKFAGPAAGSGPPSTPTAAK